MRYDVVIIGSGLGGLACGAILAQAHKKVCVLERATRPGGCMQSYTREGWHYDTGLHYIGGLEEGQALHRAFRHLGLLQLPWQRLDEQFDFVLLQGERFALAQGYQRFVETLTACFPHQSSQIQAFTQRIQHTTPDDMHIGAWQYLHDCFQDEKLIQVLSATGMRIGLQRDSLPLFSLTHALKSYIESSWRLKGDGNLIVNELTRHITEAGGQVLCQKEVIGLNAEGNNVTSVICKNGETYEAPYVIADIHPTLIRQMLEGIPSVRKSYLHRLSQVKNTDGIFTLSLRLKPQHIPYLNHNIYICDTSDVWSKPQVGESIKAVMVSCRAPETGDNDARQVDILTTLPWEECLPWKDTKVGHRGEDYKAFCQQKTKECLRLAEQALPGITEAIERSYTSTPLTYRDYLAAPEGNSFGIRKDYRFALQTFFSVKTPLKNLLLTGQNLGLPGVEGVTMTAFDTCRQILGNEYINNILS